jgi:hypothetical protein
MQEINLEQIYRRLRGMFFFVVQWLVKLFRLKYLLKQFAFRISALLQRKIGQKVHVVKRYTYVYKCINVNTHALHTHTHTHTHTHSHTGRHTLTHTHTHTQAGTHQRCPIKFFLLCTDLIIAFYRISVSLLSFT